MPQLMVNSFLPDQQNKKVNLIKVQFLEKEISAVATLLFNYFPNTHSAEKAKVGIFSESLGIQLLNFTTMSSTFQPGERNPIQRRN